MCKPRISLSGPAPSFPVTAQPNAANFCDMQVSDLASAASGHAAVEYEEEIFVWGGLSGAGPTYRTATDIYKLTLSTWTWSSVTSVGTAVSQRSEGLAVFGEVASAIAQWRHTKNGLGDILIRGKLVQEPGIVYKHPGGQGSCGGCGSARVLEGFIAGLCGTPCGHHGTL